MEQLRPPPNQVAVKTLITSYLLVNKRRNALKDLKYSKTKKYFTRLYIKCVSANIVINFDIKSGFIFL